MFKYMYLDPSVKHIYCLNTLTPCQMYLIMFKHHDHLPNVVKTLAPLKNVVIV